jgi:uncharacterized protein
VSRLSGKRALVTGASSGIGWATSRQLASAGVRVATSARRTERLERLAEAIEHDGGQRPVIVAADLGQPGEAARVADEALAELGQIDILVNNAGGGVGGMVWAVGDRAEARNQFEVDFWSPMALIHALVPAMRRRGDGTVVNVTSLRQVFSWPGMGHSSAANAALAIVTESLRLELLRFGVHVIDVVPGPINTASQGPTKLLPGIVEAVHERFGIAEPEELAAHLVEAIETRADHVFWPESVRAAYEDPVGLRATIRESVVALLGDQPVDDDFLDTFVVGNDDPMLAEARRQWELEQAASG